MSNVNIQCCMQCEYCVPMLEDNPVVDSKKKIKETTVALICDCPHDVPMYAIIAQYKYHRPVGKALFRRDIPKSLVKTKLLRPDRPFVVPRECPFILEQTVHHDGWLKQMNEDCCRKCPHLVANKVIPNIGNSGLNSIKLICGLSGKRIGSCRTMAQVSGRQLLKRVRHERRFHISGIFQPPDNCPYILEHVIIKDEKTDASESQSML